VRDLIVDGYNVLHAVPRYRALMDADLSVARDRLVDDVASFAAGEYRAIVVFDGAGLPGASPEREVGGVRVAYSPAGVDADTVIEGLARSARDEGRQAVVVTSDATTQWTVIGGGVVRMSAREFAGELAGDAGERSALARSGSASTTLDARVDAKTRSGLLRMRDRRG
jgi:predicted RNA-binding protein with PIN domain